MNNIFFILLELGILLFLFSILYWLLNQLSKQLGKMIVSPRRTQIFYSIRQNLTSLLVVSWGLLSLALIGINGWWIYQERNLQEYTLGLIRKIPPESWQSFTIGVAQSAGIFLLVIFALKPIHRGLKQACSQAKKFEGLTANDESIDRFFSFLNIHLTNSLWLLACLGCTNQLQFPNQVSDYFLIAFKVYIIIVAGLLLSKGATAIVDSLDAFCQKNFGENFRLYQRLQHLIPFIKRCVEYSIYVSTATVVLHQVEFIADFATIGPQIVRIIGVIFLCRIAVEIMKLIIEELFFRNQVLTETQSQRRLTLMPLIQSGVKYFIYFGGGIGILEILSIDPTPILAAAGIVGLAVSFGAQNLINDIISGFFILFENYYLVGDFIEVGDARGSIEAIELRTTHIRHPNGQVYILRNGDITNVVNYSKGYVRGIVDVRVSYDSDLTQVYHLIETVGQQLQAEYDEVLEATEVAGTEDLGESEILIRTSTKVKPGKHLKMQRVFRKTIKEAFEKYGIQVPYARQIWVLESQKNGYSSPQKLMS